MQGEEEEGQEEEDEGKSENENDDEESLAAGLMCVEEYLYDLCLQF